MTMIRVIDKYAAFFGYVFLSIKNMCSVNSEEKNDTLVRKHFPVRVFQIKFTIARRF